MSWSAPFDKVEAFKLYHSTEKSHVIYVDRNVKKLKNKHIQKFQNWSICFWFFDLLFNLLLIKRWNFMEFQCKGLSFAFAMKITEIIPWFVCFSDEKLWNLFISQFVNYKMISFHWQNICIILINSYFGNWILIKFDIKMEIKL